MLTKDQTDKLVQDVYAWHAEGERLKAIVEATMQEAMATVIPAAKALGILPDGTP